MRSANWLCLSVLLLFKTALVVAGDNPRKADFAYGVDVSLQSHQLYEFVVNPQMYRYLQQGDLSDLRVFDGDGTMVPLEVFRQTAKAQTGEQQEPRVVPLVFFALDEAKRRGAKAAVTVQTVPGNEQQTTTVKVESNNSEAEQMVRQYVVDLEAADAVRHLDLLRVGWNAQQLQKVNVTVLTSSDLTQWRQVAVASLYHLQVKEHRLLRTEFPLQNTSRYLLIRADDTPGFELISVHAVQKPERTVKDTAVSARAQLLRREGGGFVYQVPGKFPLRAIRVYPEDSNAVYDVLLLSGASDKQMDRVHFQGSVYNLTVEDDVVRSPYQRLSYRDDIYWHLQILENNRPEIVEAPVLEYRYYPHQVRFLSNQSGNYTIAFGSSKVTKAAPQLPLSVKNGGREAITLDLQTAGMVGGMGQLEPQPRASDTRKIVLWSVLFAVLGVMIFMVLRLVKHMRQGTN